MQRGLNAEIDLLALSQNLAVARRLAGNRPVIAVVKADAYGHGAVEVSKRLVRDGVAFLAVAFASEAKELRDSGLTGRILVLFDQDIGDVLAYDLTPVVSSVKTARELSREAERKSRTVRVHVKIDTGMGRMGFTGTAVRDVLDIAALRGIEVEGIMSHFSEADLSDASYAEQQIRQFSALRAELQKAGMRIPLAHLANSAALLALPQSHFDAVRPGLMLYGYSPLERSRDCHGEGLTTVPGSEAEMTTVMTLKTSLIAVRRVAAGTPISYGRTFITKRQSLIGVMSVGYADGFTRHFSNNAWVLIRGRKAPVAGRVCMDLTMVDVTEMADVAEGDEVVLIGRQGSACLPATELAEKAGTISYEILTSLGRMARRSYRNGREG
ncbi:MAG TPA: alanine racemase [Dissulfurispiraceae bacterium]|nr:alanine racemase [Dissulfurispiraceae bacterium]